MHSGSDLIKSRVSKPGSDLNGRTGEGENYELCITRTYMNMFAYDVCMV